MSRLRWSSFPVPCFFLVALLTGCPRQSSETKPSPKRCTEFGQQCEVSPGKLGSCVIRDGCSSKDCFVCQSQH